VLGVGGVGSNVALNLAACGIGELHLVDGDSIELTNLNRQLLYRPSDVGRSKIDVASERLQHFNPSVRVRTTNAFLNSVSDVTKAIQGADFVIRALDTPEEAQIWVNEACVRSGIPCTGAGFLPQGAIVGPTVIPGKTACLACHQTGLPRVDRGIGGTFAPIVAVTAGILANEVITYLGELGKVRTTSGMLLIEAPMFTTHFQEITRDKDCLLCGARKEVAV
jgi:molybdopterin/thiamine biosynthesis adenylyltransferase